MSKTNITITFDEEKLSALDFALRKENVTAQQKIEKAVDALYERVVPEPLREYIDSRLTPAAKPKRAVKTALQKPELSTERETPVSPVVVSGEEKTNEGNSVFVGAKGYRHYWYRNAYIGFCDS